ncbi:hypothetical protein JX265_002543 [Neoarthrinium moseri]|uniref:Rhodopsin domain-containing protein n=1 Tax=Neoarthrinium moseri TaxID=1658444 RepID=A0A9P9WUM3_9PEZI|nr:uncharacterized protein JN550_000357 [Neoarthrinium moseri]KAI1854904.1 hypothetical protein JX266_001022 [Neoarthrinium moseri]KAI1878175.1 hypothetical protein JN550_000357 [Neoarthrinium moseri]KAI1879589.1 hypothetical protein JX265_002543 [Neoarthrinium moseri]
MSSTPSSISANWPAPNYVNPETRGPAGKIVGITLVSIATVIIVLRLYTRHFISKGFGLDDILIVLSYVPATAFAILGVYGETNLQWNRHMWDVDPRLFVPSLQFSLAELILFDLSTTTTKLSMLAMIYRLTSSANNRAMNITVQVLAAIVAVNGFTFILVVIFQCRPISAYWTITGAPRKCINEAAHLLFAGIVNTLEDFILVFLPMRTVLNLDLPKRQKKIVIGLFGVGFLACAAGVVRTVYSWIMKTADNHDTTWNLWAVWVASIVELYLSIICASIPAIKPFFATYLPLVIGSTLHLRKSSRYSNDAKHPYSPNVFSGSATSFQTFIGGPDAPMLPLYKPSKTVSHKKTPSTEGLLINNSSNNNYSSTTTKGPALLQKKPSNADLNKPLPAIQSQRQSVLQPAPLASRFSEDSVREYASQRNALRFTNSSVVTSPTGSAAAEDRTTVFIVYDNGHGRAF